MIVGLTGRAGSGKSTAVDIIKQSFEIEHIDLDKIGHQLLDEKCVKKRLIETFGKSILDSGLVISREKLGKLIFSNKTKLQALNKIMHPKIKTEVDEKIKNTLKNIVIDGALLKEIGLLTICDAVISIDASNNFIKEKAPQKFYLLAHQDKQDCYNKNATICIENKFDDQFKKQVVDTFKSLVTKQAY